MPNYKICRFCPNKYVPVSDEEICPACEKAVVRAVSMPAGEPIVAGTITDSAAVAMREAVEKAKIEAEVAEIAEVAEEVIELVDPIVEVIKPVIETIAKVLAPIVEIVEVVEKQNEKDLAVLEEAIQELAKEEKAEIIAPSAPKPEEKPDAPS